MWAGTSRACLRAPTFVRTSSGARCRVGPGQALRERADTPGHQWPGPTITVGRAAGLACHALCVIMMHHGLQWIQQCVGPLLARRVLKRAPCVGFETGRAVCTCSIHLRQRTRQYAR